MKYIHTILCIETFLDEIKLYFKYTHNKCNYDLLIYHW